MTDLERFETTRETLANTAERANPAPERYDSALARYLAAVGNPRAHEPRHDNSLRDELYWNLENKVVSDVMAHAVVSVDEDATFKEIVETLARRRVSAVAAVDGERKVIGVISESDLLAKMVAGGDPRVRVRGGHSTRVQTRRESHAETASELMHSPPVIVHPEASVVHAARTAAIAHVRRLPIVVDTDGRLLGIVTRSDLLRVFLRDDEAVHAHLEDLFAAQFCIDTAVVDVAVHDAVVTLTGQVERRTLVAAPAGCGALDRWRCRHAR